MKSNLDCIYCIIKKADERYSKHDTNPENKLAYMKKVFTFLGNADSTLPSPYLSKCINDLITEWAGKTDDYSALKSKYNNLMLKSEPSLYKKILESSDKLLMALKFAMVGNFIDFAAHDDITPEHLEELIKTAKNQKISEIEYENFKIDLKKAKNLLYLCDNAGEIVFDKMLIRLLKEKYPAINLTVVVRGGPVFNDVTMKDAKEVGLCDIVNVIDNGTDVPGTYLPKVKEEVREMADTADIIISKGQGNFETLYSCNKNIYYMFLCKCDHFVKRFKVTKFTGMFVNELRTKI